jgi:signal transduction histidine kinase
MHPFPVTSVMANNWSSLRWRLMLLVLIVAVPLAGLILYEAMQKRHQAIDAARVVVGNLARDTAEDFESRLQGASQLLHAMSENPALLDADGSACGAVLALQLAQGKRYAAFYVADRAGKQLCHSASAAGPTTYAGEDYFRRAVETRLPQVGKPLLTGGMGRPVVPVVRPVLGSGNEVKRIVGTELDLAWFGQLQVRAQNLPGLSLTLWDEDGRVLYRHPDNEKWVGRTDAGAPIVKLVQDKQREGGGFELAGLDGVERIYAVERLRGSQDSGMTLTAGVAEGDIARNADRELLLAVVVLAVVLAAALFAAVAVAEAHVRRPVNELVRASARLAEGHLSTRVPEADFRGELAQLGGAFNRMAMRLQETLASRSELEREVTERKAAEERIHRLNEELQRRAAQLEAANKDLESFSYSVSHDLRAPLRAVDGYARMVEEDYATRLDEEGRRLLGVVREEAVRMGRLIDDLLGFSRTGRVRLEPVAVDMAALAQEVTAELAAQHRGAKIEVSALPRARGDRALLKQVWVNLIGNALKYSSKRAEPQVAIGGNANGVEVEYWVRDNGAGFDPRYAAKLFGVFQRLHSAEEFPGTGVGLAIVQRVVGRHGGRVWGTGKPNEGAQFFFSLPAMTEPT